MNETIDTIMVILFVLLLVFILTGFNKQQVEKHNKRMDELDKRQKDFEAKEENKKD